MGKKIGWLMGLLLAAALTAGCPPEEGTPRDMRAVSKSGDSPEVLLKKLEEEVARLEKEMEAMKPKPRLDESQTFNFDLSTAPAEGAENPKLTMVVFSDFECPFCQRFARTCRELAPKYPNDLRIVFMNFPLHNECNEALDRPFHAKACFAAEAAMEAHAQGKFWEMHDWLFEHHRDLTPERIVAFAAELGLDAAKVKEAMDTGKYKDVLMAQARQLLPTGSRGTPTVFINGKKTMNVRWDNMSQVEEFINELLNPKPEEKPPAVEPTVQNPDQLSPANVVLSDGTRLEDRLQNLISRLSKLELQKPRPPREEPRRPDPNKEYKFNLEGRPARGPASAPVTLAVFSDFTCSFCARISEVYTELVKEFPNEVRVVFKNTPNPRRRFSPEAHEAAMEAHAQGKFWEMHDAIFQNRDNLSVERLRELAQNLGLDMAKYDAAMKDHTHRNEIIADMREADAAAVNATPTVFINGKYQPTHSKEALTSAIRGILGQPQPAAPPPQP